MPNTQTDERRIDSKEIIERLDQLAEQVRQLSDLTKKLSAGFPGDDPGGHRVYHEAVIRKIEARAEFWQKMTFDLAKYGIIGLAGWAFVALWQAAIRSGKL